MRSFLSCPVFSSSKGVTRDLLTRGRLTEGWRQFWPEARGSGEGPSVTFPGPANIPSPESREPKPLGAPVPLAGLTGMSASHLGGEDPSHAVPRAHGSDKWIPRSHTQTRRWANLFIGSTGCGGGEEKQMCRSLGLGMDWASKLGEGPNTRNL